MSSAGEEEEEDEEENGNRHAFYFTMHEGAKLLQLLSEPVFQWKNVEHPVSFCIPVVCSESVRTAEEAYLNRPYLSHWEDELLLQAFQAFSKEQEEEEDQQ